MITREEVDQIAEKWAAEFLRSGLTPTPAPERTTGSA
jgi:hypothetical protein